ncbi:MAG: hypothetical protein D6768_06785 [Chloroflexi bacterium]|nr:MAG: hypothetical protein D6768_06785 [Chloroflexota bacterium]
MDNPWRDGNENENRVHLPFAESPFAESPIFKGDWQAKMKKRAYVSFAVASAVILLLCGNLGGLELAGLLTIQQGETFELSTFVYYAALLGGVGGLIGFVIGGIGGAIINTAWRVLNNAESIKVPMLPVLAAVVTGIFKGWLVMGAVGLLLGLCVGVYIYQEEPVMGVAFQSLVSLAAPIIGTVGGAIWGLIRFMGNQDAW